MIINIVVAFSTCFLVSTATASPLPFPNNVFADFFWDGQTEESAIVKRRTFGDSPDRQLKQISLSSLVDDLEKHLFTSALSQEKVLVDKQVTVPEIKYNNKSHDDGNESHMSAKNEDNKEAKSTRETANGETAKSVILQRIEKTPQTVNGTTNKITIDRIDILPDTGTLPLVPIFDLGKTTNEEDTSSEHSVTKNVSKARIEPTTTTTEDSVTTPKTIEQLKEAEEELKQKFAEIEAEPVILSARV